MARADPVRTRCYRVRTRNGLELHRHAACARAVVRDLRLEGFRVTDVRQIDLVREGVLKREWRIRWA